MSVTIDPNAKHRKYLAVVQKIRSFITQFTKNSKFIAMSSPRRRTNHGASPPSSPGENTATSTGTSASLLPTSAQQEWVPTSIRHDTSVFEQAVLRQISDSRPTSTRYARDPKIAEFYAYCQTVFCNDRYMNNIDSVKVYKFMFYQAMREPRQRGGGKNRPCMKFDHADYLSVTGKYSEWMEGEITNASRGPPPEPDNPVSESTFAQYKGCLRWIWKEQQARRVTQLTWPQIWTLACDNLHQLVKTRRPATKKKNYHEKVDYEFAPYTVVEEFPKIEDEMWVNGYGSVRSASAWLRHHYCLLQSTSGILRCESLFKAELSDLLGVTVRHDHDPHPIYVVVMQIATGKYIAKRIMLQPRHAHMASVSVIFASAQ